MSEAVKKDTYSAINDEIQNIINEVNVRIKVRYAECDAQKVVFNARYADYADIAATEYMRSLIGNHQNMIEDGFDTQVVSLHIDWFNSAVFDDVLNLQVFVSRVGNTSFTLQTRCTKVEPDQTLSAIANINTTYVVVDTKQYQKAPIPALLLENFTRHFSETINQAG